MQFVSKTYSHELIRAGTVRTWEEGTLTQLTSYSGSKQDFNLRRMGSRMLKAARLNGESFRELRDDPSATAQSVSIIAIIGLCYGAGVGLFGFFIAGISTLEILTVTLISLLAEILIAIIWSGITLLIVTKMFGRRIGYWGLTRLLLFSWTLGLLFFLMSSPFPIVFEIA